MVEKIIKAYSMNIVLITYQEKHNPPGKVTTDVVHLNIHIKNIFNKFEKETLCGN